MVVLNSINVLFALICSVQILHNDGLAASKQKSKAVTTFLEAKWEVSPVVLEVAEYLDEDNPNYFWNFVDGLSGLNPPLVDRSPDRARYEVVLEHAGRVIPQSHVSVLKLVLSLHVYSPKVEMYAQIAVERGLPATGCPSAADIGGQLTCHVDEMERLIDKMKTRTESSPVVELFNLDHHYPGSQNNSVPVVLYGEMGTPEFVSFHEALKRRALSGDVDYVLRHYIKERPNRRVRISGYGVELQIKSTEYKVQDDTQVKGEGGPDSDEEADMDEEIEGFHFNKLKTLYPDKSEQLDKLRLHLLESSSELAPLKVWQVQELSLQAAARITSAPKEEALKMLTNIAQNFPLQARSLIKTVVSSELKWEVKKNQEMLSSTVNIHPGESAVFLNGLFFDMDSTDLIQFLEVVRQELRVTEGLHKIGISEKRMSSLLALDFSPSSPSGGSPSSTSTLSSEYAVDIRDSAILWVNDIEHDKQYRRWSDSVMELLRPMFPGMLRSIRRNLFHLVMICNPSKSEVRPLLKLAESFYIHLAPLRIGLVFAVDPDYSVTGLQDAGVALLNAFNYVSENSDQYHGLSFITDVYAEVKQDRDITVDDVIGALKVKYPSADPEEILGEDSSYDTGRRLATDFVERTGLWSLPQVLLNGVPLSSSVLNADEFEESILSEILVQTAMFQKAVYRGDLTDSQNTLDYIMNQPNVMPRLNNRVLSMDKSTFVDMTGSATGYEPVDSDMFSTLAPRDKTAVLAKRWLRYLESGRPPHVITHWLVADLGTQAGRDLVSAALEQMRASGNIRVAVLLNPGPESPQHLNRLLLASSRILSPSQNVQLLSKVLADGADNLKDLKLPGVNLTELLEDLEDENPIDTEMLKIHSTYCRQLLGAPPGARVVVTNGRILGPLDLKEKFTVDDFALLERYSMNNYGDKILEALRGKKSGSDDQEEDDEGLDDIESSDMVMQAAALLVSRPQGRGRFDIQGRGEQYSVVKLPARSSTEPALDIVLVVDPVSRGAQKLGALVSVLYEALNCNVKVFLNCVEKNSDMPLKSFYRLVLEPELQFSEEGDHTAGPVARFHNMPTSVLLTQNMHVPDNWIVEVVRSIYDLDNIRLEDVDSVVHSEFELAHLLLEGHCYDTSTGSPPRGLQITLGTKNNPVQVDTIVMANLGYLQLKANPGAWILRLRQGRSADIYDVVSLDGEATSNATDIKVLVSSFRPHIMKLKVTKKSDKLGMDLLGDEDPSSGLWNSITSTFGAKKSEEEEEEKINIFSVASGHLYERFLRIMMLSVLKHTQTPVKFWFLNNYLSPTFKDFLPHMAHKYGFEYELVQYRWPRWLHQQTEKQRTIWGYKILFLDVLFPLSVKKIIFVDADQVVRADMKELVDLELGGAPYAYTPFCESRKEMDGFRFWKQGYWRNHLQGRKYHISALYVVDLRRFRRIAAGDRLRGQYQALSQDPNSLSNLDQDLPNNMIHQVAIKSLPQEWLWCETWCDDASKAYAKTIDLCNNPLTKEAKLTAAMRILPEWKEYDKEIKQLHHQIDEKDLETEAEHHFSHTHTAEHRAHSEL